MREILVTDDVDPRWSKRIDHLQDDAGKSLSALRAWVREAARTGAPSDEEARSLASGAVKYQVSKFQPCLPEVLEMKLLLASLDLEATRTVLSRGG